MFLYRAEFRGADKRVAIFFRESRRDLDLQINFLNHAGERVRMYPLNDPQVIRWQTALSAKTKDVDPGAGPYRGQENCKGCWGRSGRGLIGWHYETVEVRIYAGAPRKVNC